MAYRKQMMLIDTSKCIGCKACQVACKQWHSLPAESTSFTGSYTNPPDLSGDTLTHVKFTEYEDWRGKLHFFTFKKQCMHCNQAECQIHNRGVEKTSEGFVIFTDKCTLANLRPKKMFPDTMSDTDKINLYKSLCPYDIPRWNGTQFVKCDFCYNRFGNFYTTYRDGRPTTACELTCPPGAIQTGDAKTIMALAKKRLQEVKNRQGLNKATLWGGRGRVVFLLTEHYSAYGLPYAD